MSSPFEGDILPSLLAHIRDGTNPQHQCNELSNKNLMRSLQVAMALIEADDMQSSSKADQAYTVSLLGRKWLEERPRVFTNDRVKQDVLLWQQIVSVTGQQQQQFEATEEFNTDSLGESLITELGLEDGRMHSKRGRDERSNSPESATINDAANGLLSRIARAGSGGQLRKGASSTRKDDENKRSVAGQTTDLRQSVVSGSSSLDHLQPEMVEAIEALRISPTDSNKVRDEDIAGLKFAKQTITEVLIMPQRFPHLFASPLTRPPRGILLFGPPGTGKTMLGRWIASKVNATFINVSASTLFSKWIGESEKMVNTLFQVADHYEPTVIFIDEVNSPRRPQIVHRFLQIDSVLGARSEGDHESTRRLKNEFLAALDGITSKPESRILFLGATNLPWQIDAAALRRFPKKLYTPLPGQKARKYLIHRLLHLHHSSMSIEAPQIDECVIDRLAGSTRGYSGSDIKQLMCTAAMVPIREALASLSADEGSATVSPRPLCEGDLEDALAHTPPSEGKLEDYIKWNNKYGSWPTEVVLHDE